jgi:hypothetical protein
VQKQPVNDEWKLSFFKSVRWAFMTHEQLVTVSKMSECALAKDMVLTALSCRLDNYDTFKKEDLGFSITPRIRFSSSFKNDHTIISDVYN